MLEQQDPYLSVNRRLTGETSPMKEAVKAIAETIGVEMEHDVTNLGRSVDFIDGLSGGKPGVIDVTYEKRLPPPGLLEFNRGATPEIRASVEAENRRSQKAAELRQRVLREGERAVHAVIKMWKDGPYVENVFVSLYGRTTENIVVSLRFEDHVAADREHDWILGYNFEDPDAFIGRYLRHAETESLDFLDQARRVLGEKAAELSAKKAAGSELTSEDKEGSIIFPVQPTEGQIFNLLMMVATLKSEADGSTG